MALPKLNRALLDSHRLPANLEVARYAPGAERILQFGEGGFLRGFVDWMIDILNEHGLYSGSVLVVQPIRQGLVDKLNEQDGLYTLILRGVQNGEVVERRRLVQSIRGGFNPYTDYEQMLAAARNPQLRFVVSNTTEAGIACNPSDRPTDRPCTSFPGKITALLVERWKHFKGEVSKGLVMLPCELIERNGDTLRRCVLETAGTWSLDAACVKWIESACIFTNTLVDRIITGYPRDEASSLCEQLGYDDAMLDTGEIFHAWVIEGPKSLAQELPFDKAGLNVTWTNDYTPYRDRKVRILNGAHTMTVLAAILAGKDTVKQCMDDPIIASYLKRGLFEEIIPTLDLPIADLESFATAVLERFANPFVKHQLLSIALNSTSKFRARVLPSIREYVKRFGKIPNRLAFSLAALIAFYRGTEMRGSALIGHRDETEYQIQDDAPALEVFRKAWKRFASSSDVQSLVNEVLSSPLWGDDLTSIAGVGESTAAHLKAIQTRGALAAMQAADA
jgi:tagaturonate reductase